MSESKKTYEVNFDGLVGPSHNYSGLAFGNVASEKNKSQASSPKAAALQGLEKMKYLHDLGIKQAVLPPQERPNVSVLRANDFDGNDEQVLKSAYDKNPELFAAVCSASSMWTANAATISPSMDCSNNKVNITPANLSSKFHRSIETKVTSKILGSIFKDESKFLVHNPITTEFGDEGAANHTRFCNSYGQDGLELFVYGKLTPNHYHELDPKVYNFKYNIPHKYPARQSLEASRLVATNHELDNAKVIYAQQNPKVIDQGVFHNDVISVGNQNVFLYHEEAFVNTEKIIEELESKLPGLCPIKVTSEQVPVEDAVASYLFNTQIVSVGSEMHIVAPIECQESSKVKKVLEYVVAMDNPIQKVHFLNLRQSMQNGGGPACLRLRVVLNEDEFAAINQNVIFTEDLYSKLKAWIEKHYRDSLLVEDMVNINFLLEVREALNELTKILDLGAVYEFQ